MPIVLTAVAVVVVAIAAALVLYRRLLHRSLPKLSGQVTVDGLAAAATIGRERNGFVHVAAESMADAAFAIGFAHAQDRLWQLEQNRRVAAGRLSEFAGAEALGADRFMRRVGLRRLAEAEAERLSGDTLAMLDSYAAGVNAVIASRRPLPLEFRLLGLKPEPWTPVDSLACMKLLALGLSTNWDNEAQRLDLLRQVGPVRAAKLDCFYPDGNPTILASTAAAVGQADDQSVLALFQDAARWIPATGGGSNSWVVSGQRTTTGRPMLCNDPHLPPSLPSVWYQAHLRVAGDFESTGVTFPGMPFPIIGHNACVAWGFTNSFADCQDLVIEDFEDASLRRYRTEGGAVEAQLVREVIRVKAASDEVEEVVVTRHGPIIERISNVGQGTWRGLALQWTASQPGDAAGAILRVQRATTGAELRTAFRDFDAPSQNVVWADTAGHIGYFLCGRVPVRRGAPSGLPLPGWNGDALWARLLTPEETPAVTDPAGGVVVTANNRVVGNDFPHYIGADYMNGYRALRIEELLSGDDKLSPERMAAIQMDLVAPPARDVVRLMRDLRCENQTAEKLRLMLMEWDGSMDPRRVEPTVYTLFMQRLTEYALAPLCGDAWRTVAGSDRSHPIFGYPGNIVGRLTPVLLQHWRDDDASYLEGSTTWTDVAVRALEAVASDRRRRRRWGSLHALPLEHKLAVNRAARVLFNAGSIRVGGDGDTVMATSSIPSEENLKTRLFAPSWRQIIDVGQWDAATGIHYPGQSGQPGSRHYRDLTKLWQRNRQAPLAWSDSAVKSAVRRTLALQPRTEDSTASMSP